MKKFLAFALFMSAAVQAEELKFGDLNYLFKQNEVNLSLDANLQSVEQKTDQAGSVEQEIEGYYTLATITHGVTDRFNVFLGLNYQFNVEAKSVGNETYTQDGLANPSAGLVYRFLTQEESGLNFDLGLVGTVNIEDEEIGDASATDSKDGNAALGRSSLEVNARIGKKWDLANEWQLTAGVIHLFEGKHTDKTVAASDVKYEDDASTDLYVRAAYQYRPVNEFMINLSVQSTRLGEFTTSDKPTKTDVDYDSRIDYDFRFVAKFLVTENLIARFNYLQGLNPDYDRESLGTNVKIVQRRESAIGLGADFLF